MSLVIFFILQLGFSISLSLLFIIIGIFIASQFVDLFDKYQNTIIVF